MSTGDESKAKSSAPNESSDPSEQSEFPAPAWTRGEPRIAGATDVGVVRKINQDAFGRFDDPDRGEIFVVVADGLGGHRGGEVASRMAVDLLGVNVFEGDSDPPTRLRNGIASANDAVLLAAREDPMLDGMGTTVVCILLVEGDRSYVAHVGDSRLYRLRAGRIEAMTEDHSLVATLVREGVISEDDARTDPRRNQILRALGVRGDLEIDVAPIELQPGDSYLLCSDGLHGMLDDDEILELAKRSTRPEPVVARLVEAANAAGGTDNVTCVIANVPEPMPVDGLRGAANRLFESTRSVFTRRGDPDLGDASAPDRDSSENDA